MLVFLSIGYNKPYNFINAGMYQLNYLPVIQAYNNLFFYNII